MKPYRIFSNACSCGLCQGQDVADLPAPPAGWKQQITGGRYPDLIQYDPTRISLYHVTASNNVWGDITKGKVIGHLEHSVHGGWKVRKNQQLLIVELKRPRLKAILTTLAAILLFSLNATAQLDTLPPTLSPQDPAHYINAPQNLENIPGRTRRPRPQACACLKVPTERAEAARHRRPSRFYLDNLQDPQRYDEIPPSI